MDPDMPVGARFVLGSRRLRIELAPGRTVRSHPVRLSFALRALIELLSTGTPRSTTPVWKSARSEVLSRRWKVAALMARNQRVMLGRFVWATERVHRG
jgi:hypothetical protein